MLILLFRRLTCLLALTVCLSAASQVFAQEAPSDDPVDPDIDPIIYTTISPDARPIVERAYASGVASQPFSFQIKASNGPTTYDAQDLPDGLILNADTGLISGQAVLAGNYDIKISAANFVGRGKGKLTLTIYQQPIAAITIAKEQNAVLTDKTSTNGAFVITRNGGDLGETINVRYTVSGNAIGGVDYRTLTGKTTLKGGKFSRKITVAPFDKSGTGSRVVKVTLETGTGYTLGETVTAKLKVTDQK